MFKVTTNNTNYLIYTITAFSFSNAPFLGSLGKSYYRMKNHLIFVVLDQMFVNSSETQDKYKVETASSECLRYTDHYKYNLIFLLHIVLYLQQIVYLQLLSGDYLNVLQKCHRNIKIKLH